nr:MAG TPA_asm: hypothetical protein [Caudoviricetes sp.]
MIITINNHAVMVGGVSAKVNVDRAGHRAPSHA